MPASITDALVRKMLVLDSLIYCSTGLYLFFAPQYFAQILLPNRRSDGVHWHLIRCIGGQLLASATLSWRAASMDRPREVRTACLVLRLLSNICCAFLFFHTRAVHVGLVDPELIHSLIWFCLGSVALSALLLVITGWPIGDTMYAENRVGNILYQVDTIASIAIGLAWVLAPHWLLHRQVRVAMDESHALCGQLMGVLFIGSQVISAHALHWHRFADRAIAAETRAIVCLFILSAQVWSQVAYGEHWSDKHWVGISLFSTWTGISIAYRAYLWCSGTDRPKNSDTLHSNASATKKIS